MIISNKKVIDLFAKLYTSWRFVGISSILPLWTNVKEWASDSLILSSFFFLRIYFTYSKGRVPEGEEERFFHPLVHFSIATTTRTGARSWKLHLTFPCRWQRLRPWTTFCCFCQATSRENWTRSGAAEILSNACMGCWWQRSRLTAMPLCLPFFSYQHGPWDFLVHSSHSPKPSAHPLFSCGPIICEKKNQPMSFL